MKLWQLRVFTGPEAMGNVTGIILTDAELEDDAMAEYARRLGYPDTAFVRITDGGARVDTFTPFEEVRICFQTLQASETILRADGRLASQAPLLADTPSGRLLVTRFDDSPELPHVLLAADRIAVRPPLAELPVTAPGSDSPLVVDTAAGHGPTSRCRQPNWQRPRSRPPGCGPTATPKASAESA
jgi:predicted PhzF superfamily epimerase YddE/YHI9